MASTVQVAGADIYGDRPVQRIALAMLAHAFLAAMAADAAAKGAAERIPCLRPSPWQKFGGSWQLSTYSTPFTNLTIARRRDGHIGADDAKPSPAAAIIRGGGTRLMGGPGKRRRATTSPLQVLEPALNRENVKVLLDCLEPCSWTARPHSSPFTFCERAFTS
ncbi:hypothetical protein ACIP24_39120 [Streptomyces bobili]|uniref:hypothetical protein n=1 Tax=Streptomyces bobili TaxID=67280 RepID=UPI00382CD048